MPKTTLSLAKTTQPTLSMVVDRRVLFAKIEGFGDQRGIWIQAPAGAGKTTLIASYLQARGQPALWYQLDSTDADVSSFMYFLRRTAIKHRADSSVALPELPMNPGDWAPYARRLFRLIFQRYQGELLIVLDNHEAIPPHSGLHALLAFALEEVPRQGKLVFVSRGEPPAVFARARANNLLGLMGADELRLSADECRQLALVRRAELSPEDVDRIFQASAGWVTGAILMLEYARPAKRLGRSAFQNDGGVLYDYVALEVFSGFDDRTRKFLLDVCWSRRLSLRIAEDLSADSMARQLLVNLSRNNYFVAERDDGDSCEFTLHPLFREFLQIQARKTMTEAAVAAQQRRTAELLAQAGHPEEAVELLADAMDWEPLEAVIGNHARELLRQGRHTVLAGWLEQLPRDRLQGNLPLLCWFGQARLRHSPREARQCFDAVCRRLPASAPEADRFRGLAGAIESILAEMDDFSLLDGWIAELSTLLPERAALDGNEDSLTAGVLLSVGIALRDPARADLPERLRRAEQALRQLHDGAGAEGLLQWLILAHLLAGEFSRAGGLLEVCMQRAPAAQQPDVQGRLLLLAALQHVLSGNSGAAGLAAAECVRLAEEQSLPRLVALGRACAAALELGGGGNALVAEKPAALETGVAGDPNRLLRFLSHYLSSWRDLVQGDRVAAHHRQRQALSCAVELGIPFLEVVSSCAYAQLLFLCDDQRGGSAQLRRVHSVARDMRNPYLEFITLLIYGQVAVLNGRTSSGANAMRYALGLGRQHAYYYVPWWHPEQLADTLVLAFRQGIERDYVRDFVLRRGLKASVPPVDLPDWPWPLRIRTFGGLEISRTGSPDAESGRGNARPLQLLKALIALGARDVAAVQVAGLLWPHVDSMYSEKSLTINLHRLRRMLGDEDAITLRDGKLSLNAALVFVDTAALDRIAGQLQALTPLQGGPEPSGPLEDQAEQLLDVYRGPFLYGDEDLECVNRRRDQCRSEFVGAVLAMTEGLAAADVTRAISVYERAISSDPAAEGLYRGLMSLYSRMGRTTDAASVYQRCCAALATICRRSPSAETVSVHAGLAGPA